MRPQKTSSEGAGSTSSADRQRRYRERRRFGVLVATVEVDPRVLPALANGCGCSIADLETDRGLLNDLVARALLYIADRFTRNCQRQPS